MKKLHSALLPMAGIILLSGCSVIDSFNEVESLNAATPIGSPFTQALAEEYRIFSNAQLDTHFDYPDALYFARKGLAAAAGDTVMPEPVSDWNVSSQYAPELQAARQSFLDLINVGASETAPALTASVQVSYDCWIEFQEERWRDGTEIPCKVKFMNSLAELQALVTVPPPVEDIVESTLATPIAPAFDSEVFDIDPAEPMAPENALYLVFFDWNSAKLGSSALGVIDAAAAELAQSPASTMSVIGHTDTSGPKAFNQRLALKRAKAAKDALVGKGVDPSVIGIDAKGEDDLLVPTPDNVREPANRRVNISFE